MARTATGTGTDWRATERARKAAERQAKRDAKLASKLARRTVGCTKGADKRARQRAYDKRKATGAASIGESYARLFDAWLCQVFALWSEEMTTGRCAARDVMRDRCETLVNATLDALYPIEDRGTAWIGHRFENRREQFAITRSAPIDASKFMALAPNVYPQHRAAPVDAIDASAWFDAAAPFDARTDTSAIERIASKVDVDGVTWLAEMSERTFKVQTGKKADGSPKFGFEQGPLVRISRSRDGRMIPVEVGTGARPAIVSGLLAGVFPDGIPAKIRFAHDRDVYSSLDDRWSGDRQEFGAEPKQAKFGIRYDNFTSYDVDTDRAVF